MKHSRALRVALLATTGLLGLTVAVAYGVVYRSRHRVCSAPVAASAFAYASPALEPTVLDEVSNPFAALSDEEALELLEPEGSSSDHDWSPEPDPTPAVEESAEASLPSPEDEERVAASAAPSTSALGSLERRRSEVLGDGHDFVLTATAFLLFLAAAVTGLLSGHAGLEVLASASVEAAAVKGAGLAAIAASLVIAAVHAVANRFLNHLPQERMITFAVVTAVVAFGGFAATYLAAATLSA